jgi:hypothetical protein
MDQQKLNTGFSHFVRILYVNRAKSRPVWEVKVFDHRMLDQAQSAVHDIISKEWEIVMIDFVTDAHIMSAETHRIKTTHELGRKIFSVDEFVKLSSEEIERLIEHSMSELDTLMEKHGFSESE